MAGHAGGRYLRQHSGTQREPFGVLQGALFGVVGLILAFGLSLAVGRYESRRAATLAEANAIIKVPSTSLERVRASIVLPPAASAPRAR